MSKKIDDSRLEALRDREIADRACGILESIEAMRLYAQIMYGKEAAADVLATIGLKVMSSVLIAMTEPENYELVCKNLCKTLYKEVVEEKQDRDSRKKP